MAYLVNRGRRAYEAYYAVVGGPVDQWDALAYEIKVAWGAASDAAGLQAIEEAKGATESGPVEGAFREPHDARLRAKARLFLSLPGVRQHRVAQAILQNLLPYVEAAGAVDRGIVLFGDANKNGRLPDLFAAIDREVASFTSNA